MTLKCVYIVHISVCAHSSTSMTMLAYQPGYATLHLIMARCEQ